MVISPMEQKISQLYASTAKLEERSDNLEKTINRIEDNYEKRITKIESDNIAFFKLTTLVELQKESLDIMNKTLIKVSESNSNISYEIQGIKKDVSEVKTDVDKVNQKVESIESTDNINIPQFLKKYGAAFLLAFVSGLAGFLLMKFGLK